MTEVQKNGAKFLRERDEARAEADALRKQLEALQQNYVNVYEERQQLRQEVERLREAVQAVFDSMTVKDYGEVLPPTLASVERLKDALRRRG